MKKIYRTIRDLFRKAGYDLKRYNPDERGLDPFPDMKFFLEGVSSPTIIDVGANIGQSVDNFKHVFPNSTIHSFEPSPSTYAKLETHCKGLNGVTTWNYGVGSRREKLEFIENTNSDMSSFLKPSEFCWGNVEKVTDVDVITLDSFTEEQKIEFVHILKSDTQGYDFEVFKGAEKLMRENKIGLIHAEFIFSDMYKDLPLFHEVLRFLSERNFTLVSFYKPNFQQDLIGWAEAMFINIDYNRLRMRNANIQH